MTRQATDLDRIQRERGRWLRRAATMIGCVAVLFAVPAGATVRPVDNTNVGCSDVSGAPYCTIQAAINASAASDTVSVGAGLYFEEVVITVPGLILHGVQFAADARTRSGPETVVGSSAGGFRILADNVTIQGFDVENVSTDCSVVFTALCAGIHADNTTSGRVIKNNILRNNIEGLYLNSNGVLQSQVTQNLIQTNNVPGPAGGNGIYSDQGLANAVISNNTFTGHDSSSIFLANASNVTISNNAFVNEATLDVDFSTSSISVTHNTFDNSRCLALVGTSGAVVSNNTFNGCIHPVGSVRVRGDVHTVAIHHNVIVDGQGAALEVDTDFGGQNSGVSATFNRIVSNAAGANVTAGAHAGAVGAVNNWWGCNAGPSGAPCDVAVGAVNYTPWLTLTLTADLDEVYQGCQVPLHASLNINSNLFDTGGAIPDGTPITFSSNVGVVSPAATVLTGGLASATLDTDPDNGDGLPSATVDNQTVSTPVLVHYALQMVVGGAHLRLNTGVIRSNGYERIWAHINDTDTNGRLRTNLLAGLVTLRVRDSDASFDTSVVLSNCLAKKVDKIICKSTGRKVVAVFEPYLGPFVYRTNIVARRLPSVSGTGSLPLAGPVHVNLVACSNTGTARRDDIDNCKTRGPWLHCVEN